MRRIVTHPLALLLTFSCGLLLTLLWGSLINKSVRHLARRAEQRLIAPHVAEVEKKYRNRRILLDKRDYWEAPSSARPLAYRELEAIGDATDEVKRRILPKLFPDGTLEHYGECSRESRERRAESEADLAWAREKGQFVGYVPDWHDGSFTYPGTFETLYQIDVGECNAREGPMPPSQLLAVFDRWDGLHASVNALPGDGVYAVHDVDGDDVDEVLLGRGEMRVGDKAWADYLKEVNEALLDRGEMRGLTYVSKLRLVSLKGGSLRVIHDFGVGYIYSFSDPVGNDRVITIPVIYYTPRGDGETPEFHVDFYRASCRKSEGCGFMPRPSAWRYFKSGSLSENE